MDKTNGTIDLSGASSQKVFSPLLLSLRARCVESARKDALFRDPLALKLMDSVDYRFTPQEISWANQMGIAVRTYVIDEQVKKTLAKQKRVNVVNLGCGLDTRFSRIPGGVLWYDLDLPEVIVVRKKLLVDDRLRFIEKSLFDLSWMDAIPPKENHIFIAEGVLAYFPEERVKRLILAMKERFPGSDFIFTAVSPFMLSKANNHVYSQQTNIVMQWGINCGRELESWNRGIKFVDEWYYLDICPKRWKWRGLLRIIPPFRKAMKIIQVKFTKTDG